MSKAAGPLLSVNGRHQGITCYRFANAAKRSLIASRIDPLGSIECRRGNLCGQDAQGDRSHRTQRYCNSQILARSPVRLARQNRFLARSNKSRTRDKRPRNGEALLAFDERAGWRLLEMSVQARWQR